MFALCCRGANVERVSLTYWPSSETLLHLCIVHHQLGALAMLLDELSTAYENAVTSDGVDDETRTRCCALVAARTRRARRCSAASSRSPSPTRCRPSRGAGAGGGRACVPIRAVRGGHPRARGGGGEQDPDQPRARSISKLPDGLRGCCAGRWLVADVPPEDSKMGDLSATVARWEVTGFGPALDRVLGDADGFRGWSFHLGTHVSVDKFERRHSTAAVLDELVKQLTPAERFVASATSPLSRRAARSRPWAGWAAAAASAGGGGRWSGEGGGGAHRRRRRARRQPALALADAQLDRVLAVNLANVDALDNVEPMTLQRIDARGPPFRQAGARGDTRQSAGGRLHLGRRLRRRVGRREGRDVEGGRRRRRR